ncbi:GGDEF domain-containing protein [Paucibacter sp. R3-3]|uniref:diguanylate cyclase n=1 Tax=Roseateles agri TaxID=3098619 RepID=A0ABU5DA92_9BURK|nr:GGDEF domain-containing protein [Paucibacter sp. R3-3]MDY0743201.1 GGDEF domain-containing protein [Paucibacter sp. R3-3]
MHIDNATLFSLLLIQSLMAAVVLTLLMGAHASKAARWGQASLLLQALGWLALADAGGGSARLLLSLAMLALSASLSCLWRALALWLQPRPGQVLMTAAPVLMPAVYALQFGDTAFRVGWAHYWLAFQLLMLAISLAWPKRPEPGAPASHLPAADNRRWRALLLLAVVPLLVICLLRGSLGLVGHAASSPLDEQLVNTVLGLLCQWALMLMLLALVLAWRGEIESGLARLAQTDGLTGLADRRAFVGRAADMISMARRHEEPLALMVLDIDHLKALNAAHTREAGDRALALFGSCVQQQMRLGDLAGRIGGEEFAVLMARADAQGPTAMDRRMRDALATRAPAELGFGLEFSAGWARLRPGDRSVDDLLRRAETALYEAKKSGRAKLVAEPGVEHG